ncbi:BUSH-AND-CHLOROTIC-DWARF 1, ZRIZI, Arabidopsis abnormal shoot4 [Hibiscus trionum]|uniref:Protein DETOXIFICATION n=1 Tax=Hibiscus trionum TaxID=183268 RepID=A0A9W7H1Q0_HIBTR|nr:BUSH-AND-CHLOROTIC-DWARF 1, ZRIZI, Arabidopsis abnormal shoot4 [Hibiscus trionum]
MSDQGVPEFYSSITAPLLVNEDINDVEQDSLQCHCHAFRPSLSKVIEEMKQLYAIALPMIITGLLIYGKSAISMFFMGKLGKEALAGGAMSIGIANITGYSVISGLAMGMEAISSQACGAKQWPLMGQTLQRTVAILILACLPISVLWLNIEPILLFCAQDPVISSVASTYLALSLPDLLFQCLINPLKIYLRTQNVTLPLMLTAAFALALHAPINYILVYHLSLGIQGIALAVAFTDFNLLIALLFYLWFSGICDKTWNGWSLDCFYEWKPILTLAIPSCISVCLEWWWYELMILLSGFLTNASEAVATMGILIQATSLIYIFPSSLSLAVSARVGNELGANQPGKAKTSSMVALSCAVFSSFMAMVFMITMRNAWGRIFTNDKAILSLTAMVMPVAGLCELGNYPQTTGCGVLRGSARPSLGANINLGSFYGVGLPVALLMGFVVGVGLLGLWFGLLAAQVVCAIYMVVVVARTDWAVQAERAEQLTRMNAEANEVHVSKIQGLISIILGN